MLQSTLLPSSLPVTQTMSVTGVIEGSHPTRLHSSLRRHGTASPAERVPSVMRPHLANPQHKSSFMLCTWVAGNFTHICVKASTHHKKAVSFPNIIRQKISSACKGSACRGWRHGKQPPLGRGAQSEDLDVSHPVPPSGGSPCTWGADELWITGGDKRHRTHAWGASLQG